MQTAATTTAVGPQGVSLKMTPVGDFMVGFLITNGQSVPVAELFALAEK